MQIKCSECQKPINIPDDKLPRDRAVTLGCPYCKAKIKVDRHLRPAAPQPAEPKSEDLDASTLVVSEEDEDEELKIYDEHDQIALVLDEFHKEKWAGELGKLGFKIEYAKSPEQAVHKMKFTQYHLAVLHENFGGATLDNSPIYQSLREMPMTFRRKIFVALVGKHLKSLSNMQAYQYSVNLAVNEKDMDKISLILKKSIGENETFYKVFKETLHALGKA